MRARLFLVLFAAIATAYARPALLEHVPLQWRPTSELRLGVVQLSQARIQFLAFQDIRSNKELIGENVEDDKPKPVTTSDDVGAFVGTHFRELFDHAGMKTVDSDGDVTIRGEITQFYVRESSTYNSEVGVRLTVADRAGKTLWSGLASGDAERFGRSYKLENYYEVLSDAIVNTVSSSLDSAPFQSALAAH
jgi:hypothetical protein